MNSQIADGTYYRRCVELKTSKLVNENKFTIGYQQYSIKYFNWTHIMIDQLETKYQLLKIQISRRMVMRKFMK